MSLYFLPYELIRLILPYLSLRDICRLNLAANSHSLYEQLLKAIQGLEYDIGPTYAHFVILESLIDWLLKYEIKMKTLMINKVCWAQTKKYISTMGVNVTQIWVSNNTNMLELTKYLPNVEVVSSKVGRHFDPVSLLEYFPKVTSICTGLLQTPTFNLGRLLPKQYLQIKEITLGTLRDTVIPYIKRFPRLEKLRLPDFTVDDVKAMTLSPSSCSYLKLLEISIMRDTIGSLQYLLTAFPQLQQLELDVKSQTCDGLYNPVQTVNSNLRVLKLTLSAYHDIMFHLLADCKLSNLQELQISSHCSYSPSNRLSVIRFLSSCKELKIFTFVDFLKLKTSCQLLYDVLYAKLPQLRHLDIQQGNRQPLVRQENEPILTVLSLKSLSMTQCDNNAILLLKYCPNLTHLKIGFIRECDVDSKLLYEYCPNLRSLTYEGMKGYELFKYSHMKLEKIQILGPLQDNSSKSETIRCSSVQLPSLNELSIGGNIDPHTWNRILFSCRFNITRFGLFRSRMLEVDQIAILDSLFHHSNFKSLQLVVCDLEKFKRQELETMSGGRISFRCSRWIEYFN